MSDTEREQLHQFIKRLSDALLAVRPLGGSEMFVRVGDRYYADPDYCKELIVKMRDELHEYTKETFRLRKQLSQPGG